MTGRYLFEKPGVFIQIIINVDSFLPYRINNFLYECFRNFPGKAGVFIRYIFLHNLVANCGQNVSIAPNVILNNKKQLFIDNNVSIHSFCYLEAYGGIKIGNDVSIAHNCSVVAVNHTWNDSTVPTKYNIHLFKLELLLKMTVGLVVVQEF
jgi:acetyltransferase-like isoleucine patch superfamily enzyme